MTDAAPSPLPGRPFPLGATVAVGGTNFAVVADGDRGGTDSGVTLCLLDGSTATATGSGSSTGGGTGSGTGSGTGERRIRLTQHTNGIWHAFVPGVGPGQRYGYRVAAHDETKLLLDPYARRVDRTDYDLAAASTAGADTAGRAPLGIVTAPVRAAVPRPEIPWEHTVVYEAHVKGLTRLHPAVPAPLRGTFAGIAHPAIVDHLRSLKVTAVQLLPVHAHAPEPMLAAAGRPNYWGYSTLSYFAPHPGYAARPGAEIAEFAQMVDALHAAGIEVFLDVVYNHTCEGSGAAPAVLSWRGLSPDAYYLAGGDLTGTGNTLDPGGLATVRLVVDSLRYWADDLGVDGFRFDLAAVLGRPGGGPFDPGSPLLTAIEADPILRTRKLIAEPWDATGDGYSLGAFRSGWAEWNDLYRGTVRDFWRGKPVLRDLGYRLTGSEDLFGDDRHPWASVNFVTAHDGFTLRDLVSYERKHNEANGQGGTDGSDDNRSANYGTEGDGDDHHPLTEEIVQVRLRQARNLAATLLLSTGTPMICAGDEIWRTQRGNNNAYNTDGPLTWIDWPALDRDEAARDMLAFFRHVLAVRADAPALHQGEFFSGRPRSAHGDIADLVWFGPDGTQMSGDDWFDTERRCVQLWIDGAHARSHGPHGQPVVDRSWLLVLHAGTRPIRVTLPGDPFAVGYRLAVDTGSPDGSVGPDAAGAPTPAGTARQVPARTLYLFEALRAAAGDGTP